MLSPLSPLHLLRLLQKADPRGARLPSKPPSAHVSCKAFYKCSHVLVLNPGVCFRPPCVVHNVAGIMHYDCMMQNVLRTIKV